MNLFTVRTAHWRNHGGNAPRGHARPPNPGRLTVVAENKESTAAEVAVEFDQDLVGGAVDGLQRRVSAELADLW